MPSGVVSCTRQVMHSASIPVSMAPSVRISGKWDACLLGNGAQLFDYRHNQRNTLLAAQRLRLAVWVAGDERTVSAGRGLRGAKDADEIIHLTLEFVGVDEAVNAKGAEEVADSLPHAACGNFLAQREGGRERAPVRSAEHGAQYVDNDGKAITFVAAALAIGAERQKRAAGNDVIRICRAAALIVDAPALGNGLAAAARHFDFAVSGGAGCHVDHDGWLFLGGKSDGNGIRAEHALRAPQRRDQLGGVGHGHTDEVALKRFQHIVPGETEMIAVADADPARAGFFGHVHGNFIRLRPDNKAEAVVAIDACGTRGRTQDFDLRRWIDEAFAEQIDITGQTSHAVRIDAAQIGAGQPIAPLHSVSFGHPETQEDASAELAQHLDGKYLGLYVRHAPPSFCDSSRLRGQDLSTG